MHCYKYSFYGTAKDNLMEYSLYKMIHIIAVILFLGNIVTGLFWMRHAVQTKNITIIAHTMKGIIDFDNYFTTPGVIIISAAGVMTAIIGHFPMLTTGWILWSIILFIISGIVFMAKVAPLQKKIYAFTTVETSATNFDWEQFHSLYRAWDIWGLLALVTPLAAAVMMVMKIPQ